MRRALLAALPALLALAGAGCGGADEPGPPASPSAVERALASPVDPVRWPAPEQLPGLAVELFDLPSGFTVGGEGGVEAPSPVVAAFRRLFLSDGTPIGGSAVTGLTSDVALFRTSEDAAAGLAAILRGFLDEGAEERIATLIATTAGLEVSNVVRETAVAADIGESAFVARASFQAPDGPGEAVFVATRVGPFHHALMLLGPPGELTVEDATDLAARIVPRLEGALVNPLAA